MGGAWFPITCNEVTERDQVEAVPEYSVSKAAVWSATNGVRLLLKDQGTLVTGLHVGMMDTDMVRDVVAKKSAPTDIASLAFDGVESGSHGVLADDVSRWAISQRSADLSTLFPELA